jgi:hypothetical protein
MIRRQLPAQRAFKNTKNTKNTKARDQKAVFLNSRQA